jgi:hypothetical protein
MKISDLVKELQDTIREDGDLPVYLKLDHNNESPMIPAQDMVILLAEFDTTAGFGLPKRLLIGV